MRDDYNQCRQCGCPLPRHEGVVDEISDEDLAHFPEVYDPLFAIEIYDNAVAVTRPAATVIGLLAAAGVMALLGTLSRILGF